MVEVIDNVERSEVTATTNMTWPVFEERVLQCFSNPEGVALGY